MDQPDPEKGAFAKKRISKETSLKPKPEPDSEGTPQRRSEMIMALSLVGVVGFLILFFWILTSLQ